MFRAGSSNHAAPHTALLYSRSIFDKRSLCECCTRRTPQDPIDDTPLHDQKKKKIDGDGDAASYT